MKKIKVRYIGKHQPNVEIEIGEKMALKAIEKGECELIQDGKKTTNDVSRRDKGSNGSSKQSKNISHSEHD